MGMVQLISKKHIGWETVVGETIEREIARVSISVTSSTDLPTKYGIAGITIYEGSRAWDITNGDRYGYVEGSGWSKQATGGGGGGGTITVDSALSLSSTNPVQNRVITSALTPISESEYGQLVTKDKPIYFIYED